MQSPPCTTAVILGNVTSAQRATAALAFGRQSCLFASPRWSHRQIARRILPRAQTENDHIEDLDPVSSWLGPAPSWLSQCSNPHSRLRHRRVPNSRDFVPWRFSDAGRRAVWLDPTCRRPKTCTDADIGRGEQGAPKHRRANCCFCCKGNLWYVPQRRMVATITRSRATGRMGGPTGASLRQLPTAVGDDRKSAGLATPASRQQNHMLQQFPVDLNQDGFRGPGEALWH